MQDRTYIQFFLDMAGIKRPAQEGDRDIILDSFNQQERPEDWLERVKKQLNPESNQQDE